MNIQRDTALQRFGKSLILVGHLVLLSFLLVFVANKDQAQIRNRLDLDDLMIKGELRNDDRFMILSREKNEMKNYVKFRTNYREEMLQELPAARKRRTY